MSGVLKLLTISITLQLFGGGRDDHLVEVIVGIRDRL
jgi:hypothetical protein